MTKKKLFWIIGFLFLASCNKNEKGLTPNDAVTTAFDTKFPSATNVEWERKNTYDVADFTLNNLSNSAWFDNTGKWYMTEVDLENFTQLPNAIQTAFKASLYKDWKIEDLERLDRLNADTIYAIEVEKEEQEFDLFYSSDGILIKAVPDFDHDNDFDDFLPDYTIPTVIKTYIETNYPGARIIELDHENGGTEIDIIHENRGKELFFNSSYEWLSTHYNVTVNEVETTAKQAFEASIYKEYYIDDIVKYETPSSNYYIYELEKGSTDVNIKITIEGIITVE